MTAPAPDTITGTVESFLGKNDSHVLKGLNGSVLLGRWPSAPIIESLFAPGGQIVVPTAYEAIGHIGEDGLTTSSEDEVTSIPSWGSSQAVRRDIQRRDINLQFLALQDKRLSRELYDGLDLRGVEMPADVDEITYDHPLRPPQVYWRVVTLSTDGMGDSLIVRARMYAKMNVSERDDYVESDGEDLGRNVTLSTAADDEAGFSCREFLVGPGVRAKAESMGWAIAS